jgi:predicted Zn-dependent protease
MLAHRLAESPRPHRHGRAGSGPDREPMACRCCRGLSRRRLLGGAAVATTLPLAGCDAAVPDWLADLLVPEPLAAELGAQAFREMLRTTPPVRDADLQRRLAGTGERIVAASGARRSDWQFVVLDGPSPNAFALPGGKVGVFAGMLRVAASEAQLATVLGHEVGHVNARHAAQRIVAEHAVALALRLGTTLLATSDVPIPPQLVVALGGGLADVGLIRPFGRAQELQADELGLRYMARAGYDPREAVAFWRRMLALEGDERPPAFLSTHPASEQRIAALERLLPALGAARS